MPAPSFRVTRAKLRAVMDAVYRAIFPRLDTTFPKFKWKRNRKGDWTAAAWPRGFAPFAGEKDPHRLNVYADNPWTIKVHGHKGVALLRVISRAKRLSGEALFKAIRKLCDKAGVPFPEAELREEADRARIRGLQARLERGFDLAEASVEGEGRSGGAAEAFGDAPSDSPGVFAALASGETARVAGALLGPEAEALVATAAALAPLLDGLVDLLPEVSAAFGELSAADRAAGRVRAIAGDAESAGLGPELRGLLEASVGAEEARARAEASVRGEAAWSRLWRSLGRKEARFS